MLNKRGFVLFGLFAYNAFLIGIIVLMYVLILCSANSKDITKKLNKGEWDGNYIYSGNSRIRTDGEEYQKLISGFTEDGVDYHFDRYYSGHTFYHGDHVFIGTNYGTDQSGQILYGAALFVYDLKDNSCTKICSTGVSDDKYASIIVSNAFDDFFVVAKNENRLMEYYIYDYDLNCISSLNTYSNRNYFAEEFYFWISSNHLHYANYTDQIDHEMPDYDSAHSHISFDNDYVHPQRVCKNVYIIQNRLFVSSSETLINVPEIRASSRVLSDNIVWGHGSDNETEQKTICAALKIEPDGTYSVLSSVSEYLTVNRTAEYEGVFYVELTDVNKSTYLMTDRDWTPVNVANTLAESIGDEYNCVYGKKCGDYYYTIYSRGTGFVGSIEHMIRFDSKSKQTEWLYETSWKDEFVVRSN